MSYVPRIPEKIETKDVETISRTVRSYIAHSRQEIVRQKATVADMTLTSQKLGQYNTFCSRVKEWEAGLNDLENILVEIESIKDVNQRHERLRLLFKQAGIGKSSFRVN